VPRVTRYTVNDPTAVNRLDLRLPIDRRTEQSVDERRMSGTDDPLDIDTLATPLPSLTDSHERPVPATSAAA